MKTFNRTFYCFAILIVLFAVFTPETDARRKILRGRKTITRTYFREAVMPAWAVVILIAFAEMLIGGIVYIVLKKLILDQALTGTYTPARAIHHPNEYHTP